jgi:hypothetical protein
MAMIKKTMKNRTARRNYQEEKEEMDQSSSRRRTDI